MTEHIANLVGALRQELQQCGEMLSLLERQQRQIGARSADEVYQSISPIKLQGLALEKARAYREECRAQLSQALRQPTGLTFGQLMPLLPADSQKLVSALVRENNELLARVRQRARQNHLRLSRSIEMMQGLLKSLFPTRSSRVYNDQGNMKLRRIAPCSVYEAIC